MEDDDLIRELLVECYHVARKSPDPSNQNGAIVVNSDDYRHVISTGCNEFPPGVVWDDEKIKDRDWKLLHIEHAERNAIYPLVKKDYLSDCNLTMICPWFVCSDCAKAILLSGIKRVIGHNERMDMTPERWKASVEAGLSLLFHGGVQLSFYHGKIDCEPIIVNGELWYP